MSKEKKLEKKEQKAAKKAAKVEKKQAADYAKLVKKIDKKNVKLEKKASKKGKPFVPVAVPTQEEAFAADNGSKGKKIALMIILILLIWYLIYFIVMWFSYVAPAIAPAENPEDNGPAETQVYDRYSNPHEITTTPDYSVADAKALLKQVLHDNWKDLGYGSDPSSNSIGYTSNIVNVNNADCYVFTAGSKSYAVSVKLSAVYSVQNGEYVPVTFEKTDYLFN